MRYYHTLLNYRGHYFRSLRDNAEITFNLQQKLFFVMILLVLTTCLCLFVYFQSNFVYGFFEQNYQETSFS